tara:strand:- start:2925 stop:3347 length:423 start_codon:yes stop_codon:yes gene_type:complete
MMLGMETNTPKTGRTDPPPAPPFQGGVRTARFSSPRREEAGAASPTLPELTSALRENILEAQDMLARGDVKGAEALGKATLQLIRAVEAQVKLEESQTPDKQEGVFLAAEDIEAARAELLRRLDRIAKTIRPDEMGEGAA